MTVVSPHVYNLSRSFGVGACAVLVPARQAAHRGEHASSHVVRFEEKAARHGVCTPTHDRDMFSTVLAIAHELRASTLDAIARRQVWCSCNAFLTLRLQTRNMWKRMRLWLKVGRLRGATGAVAAGARADQADQADQLVPDEQLHIAPHARSHIRTFIWRTRFRLGLPGFGGACHAGISALNQALRAEPMAGDLYFPFRASEK